MSDSTSVSVPSLLSRRIVVLGFVVFAAWFYLRTLHYSAPSHVHMSSVALENLDGSPFPPQTTEGKAVLVNFWAPWCGPCLAEIPWLMRLQAANPELVVIGVEDDPDEFRNAGLLATQMRITYPLVRTSGAIRSAFGHVVLLPTTLYVSRSGKVLHTVSGVIPESLMKRYANDALAAK